MLSVSSRTPTLADVRAVPVRPDTTPPVNVPVYLMTGELPVGDVMEIVARFLPDARATFIATLRETDDRARARAAALNRFQDAVRDWAVGFLNRYSQRAAGDFVRDVLREGVTTITAWGR